MWGGVRQFDLSCEIGAPAADSVQLRPGSHRTTRMLWLPASFEWRRQRTRSSAKPKVDPHQTTTEPPSPHPHWPSAGIPHTMPEQFPKLNLDTPRELDHVIGSIEKYADRAAILEWGKDVENKPALKSAWSKSLSLVSKSSHTARSHLYLPCMR